jgi:hypothetical protein
MKESIDYYNLEVAFEVTNKESFYKLMYKIKPFLCKKYDGFTYKASCVLTNKQVFDFGIKK